MLQRGADAECGGLRSQRAKLNTPIQTVFETVLQGSLLTILCLLAISGVKPTDVEQTQTYRICQARKLRRFSEFVNGPISDNALQLCSSHALYLFCDSLVFLVYGCDCPRDGNLGIDATGSQPSLYGTAHSVVDNVIRDSSDAHDV
jgi:hypothetical protein